MLEIRGRQENVLRFPRAVPSRNIVWEVARWMAAQNRAPSATPAISWQVIEDSDHALLLLPVSRPDPGFAIMVCDGEYEVLVCDPEDIEELGPFPTVADALAGISHWLALPAVELSREPEVATTDAVFRSAFAVPCPDQALTLIPNAGA